MNYLKQQKCERLLIDYETEVNAFYDWLETNTLAASAIVLWHALMSIACKTGWLRQFAVAVSVLEAKTGLKKDAIYDARNKLQQLGRINWISRKGNQSALYEMISFASVIPTQEEACEADKATASDKPMQIPTQYPTQTPTQLPTIIDDDIDDDKDDARKNIPYIQVLDYYLLKACKLTESPDDIQVAQKLISDGISVEIAKKGIDKAFLKYKPKFIGDKINSLSFCDKVIRQIYENERVKVVNLSDGEYSEHNQPAGYKGDSRFSKSHSKAYRGKQEQGAFNTNGIGYKPTGVIDETGVE
ncbi:MAG: hypothetical protein ACOZCL_08580 [Bacillota bacterium]